MPRIGFPIPRKENEQRRAMTPREVAASKCAAHLVFEQGYGVGLGYADSAYAAAGAGVAGLDEVCACPIICNPKPMPGDPYFVQGKTLFGWLHAVQGRWITDELVQHGMTGIAWEDMFEQGRHTFWRNNEISGEAAIPHAFLCWGRVAYGTRAALIGRGNVARGAFRALERAGCHVQIYDRKTVALLRQEIGQFDIVVNAVLWDVFRTDHLVYEKDLDRMQPGGLIIDISCDEHMGIESSRPTTIEDPVYTHKGIMHYAVDHTPTLYFHSATDAISAAARPFIETMANGQSSDVLKHATAVQAGRILDERIIRFQKRG